MRPPRNSARIAPVLFALLGWLALVAAACGANARVGYEGPLPSVHARQTLNALTGRTLPAGSVAFCANELRIHGFLVTPNQPTLIVDDTTSTGAPPVGRYWIPVLCDGDIADLHRRVTGSVPSGVVGAPSSEYTRFMTGR